MACKKIGSSEAFFIILGSLFFTLVLCAFLLGIHWKRKTDPSYKIVSMIHTGSSQDALRCAYLCELLSLAADKPQNLYAFDIKEGEKRLCASPFIQNAHIEKIPPGTLYVDYTLRTPKAWMGDLENTLIDEKGCFFPAYPFLSPKIVPEIYFGFFEQKEKDFIQNQQIVSPKFPLAISVLKSLEELQKICKLSIKRIDVSNAYQKSFGQKEIIVEIVHQKTFVKAHDKVEAYFPIFLRLSPFTFRKQLGNYSILWKSMEKDFEKQIQTKNVSKEIVFAQRTVDLRIEPMAFIDEKN